MFNDAFCSYNLIVCIFILTVSPYIQVHHWIRMHFSKCHGLNWMLRSNRLKSLDISMAWIIWMKNALLFIVDSFAFNHWTSFFRYSNPFNNLISIDNSIFDSNWWVSVRKKTTNTFCLSIQTLEMCFYFAFCCSNQISKTV